MYGSMISRYCSIHLFKMHVLYRFKKNTDFDKAWIYTEHKGLGDVGNSVVGYLKRQQMLAITSYTTIT